MPPADKRDLIVKTALELFARDGFHATGIDRIADRAGVSKKTLYNHFRSKDELVLAVLAFYDSSFRNSFVREVESAGQTAEDRLLAVFDVAGAWFSEKTFFGCLFVNAIGEHSAPESELRRACQGFKRRMRDYIRELVEEAGLSDSAAARDEIALLLEGAIVTAQVEGSARAAKTAKRIAKRLIPVV